MTPELTAQLHDGFGPHEDGNDDFNAVVGLFGMLNRAYWLRGFPGFLGSGQHHIPSWVNIDTHHWIDRCPVPRYAGQ